MTTKYFKELLALVIAAALGSPAFAGGIECKTCPCPAGINYIPKAECNIKTAGAFCINDNGHIYGWGISNEKTYYIDNLAGVPNPYTSYHILPSPTDSSFKILEMKRYGEIVSSHGPFQWINLDTITDGKNTYKVNSCN